ncbi:hypothetical protein SUGI_0670880 [Cryptomeria japonica]|nr:hypothetical protein SUGI_0670880 [Cryptomeria japonica]
MDRNNGRELFCWHAFDQSHPSIGYEALVEAFVTVCQGLPLSLQVLGRHVRNRSKSYWDKELIKASEMLHRDIKKRLRISFDSLDDEEKQVFMDVACFFVGKTTNVAKEIMKASGWNVNNAIETLKDKCLLFEEEEEKLGYQYWEHVLRMHDHLRDLGREMADELSPPHRLWRPQDLKSLELMDLKIMHTNTNIRCFQSVFVESMDSQFTFFLGQSNICYEKSASLLWLELEIKSSEQPSIPSWIPLQNLRCLEIKGGRLEKLWKNHTQVLSQLRKLRISENFLKEFPDFSKKGFLQNWRKSSNVKAPMSGIKKIDINGEYCVSKIFFSGIHYPNLKSVKLHSMKNLKEVKLKGVETLNHLDIKRCYKLKRLTGTSGLTNLVLLDIIECPDLEFEELCLAGMKCLERIDITNCKKLKRLTGTSDLANLMLLNITECPDIRFEELCLEGMKCLERIDITNCKKLKRLTGTSDILNFQSDLPNLVMSNISQCPDLEEVCLGGMKCLERIDIINCKKLKRLTGTTDLANLVLLNISQCPDLEQLCLGDLEFEELRLRNMKYLEKITFQNAVKLKYFELDGCQNLIKASFDCKELVELKIRGCPELEMLPYFTHSSCLKKIIIDGCGKFEFLWLESCKKLRSVSGNFQFSSLYVDNCPELEELPDLSKLGSLRQIVINSCEKLENLAGIKELCRSFPSGEVDMIGRAVDGAESILNKNLFRGVVEIGTHETYTNWSELSAVIVCFVVVVDSSTWVEDINQSLICDDYGSGNYSDCIWVREGEWIITIVVYDDKRYSYLQKSEHVLLGSGILRKAFRVELKKGEEWKGVAVVRTIVDKLYIF